MGSALLTFALLAAVLTVTPGLDTMLVLRTSAVASRKAGAAAIAGIALGCLVWAVASAVGVTAVLAASRVAFDVLRFAGAGYLGWLGVRALWRARSHPDPRPADSLAGSATPDAGEPAVPVESGSDPKVGTGPPVPPRGLLGPFRIGLTSNLLNPKVGAFYLSALPQFLPAGVNPLAGALALGSVHVIEGVLWLSLVMLAVVRARAWLSRPAVARRLEQVTGVVFLAVGLRLVLERGPR